MKFLLIVILAVSCAEKRPDTGEPDNPAAQTCAGEGEISLQLGTGAGSEFYPLKDGDSVVLDVAPQGGFGVSIRALTTGLLADDVVNVNLLTEIQSESSGEFLSEGIMLFCQDDGHGMLWGVVVGFDPSVFPDNDALLSLDGQAADLIVEVTDVEGRLVSTRVTVIIEAGG
jgi:hypothetical protein